MQVGRKLGVGACALVLLGLGIASTTSARAGDGPRYGALRTLQFDNGLRVVVQHTPGDPTVAASWRIDAGWDDDPEGLPGAAHLVEHLWFRTPSGTSDQWHDARARGCQDGASTSHEATTYHRQCPAAELNVVLDAIVDQVSDPLADVDSRVIRMEASIIRQEARERMEGGLSLVQAVHERLLPLDHPIQAALAEPVPVLEETEGLRDWVEATYVPENVVVAISGAAPVDAVQAHLEAAFGPAVATTPPEPRVGLKYTRPLPARVGEVEQVGLPRLTSSMVWAWNLPAVVADSSISRFLASGVQDALDDALSDDDDVFFVSCQVSAHPLAGALLCEATLAHTEVPARDLWERGDRALRSAWKREGRKRVRRAIARERQEAPQDLLFSFSRASRRARAILSDLAAGREPRTVEDRMADVRGWKPERLIGAVSGWTAPSRAVRVAIVPDEEVEDVKGDERRAREVPDRPAPELPEAPLPLPTPEVAVRALPTGLHVIGIAQPDSPYAMVSARVYGGTGTDPAGLARVAENFSWAPARRESAGIRSGERVTRGYVEVYATAPGGDVGRASRAVRDQLRVRVPTNGGSDGEKAVERYVRQRTRAMEVLENTPSVLAEQRMTEALVPDHGPSADLTRADLRAIEAMSPATVLAYLRRTYQPGNTVVLVTGPDAADTLADDAARAFARWEPLAGVIPAPYPLAEPAGAPASVRLLARDPALRSAHLSWRCRLPDGLGAIPAALLEDALSDVAWRRLRHRSGLVYTPSVDISRWPDGTSVLRADIRVPIAQVGTALSQWEAALKALERRPDDDVGRSRVRVRRTLISSLSLPEGAENAIYEAFIGGRELGRLAEDLEADLAVDAAEVVAPLKRCRLHRSWLIRGPDRAMAVGARLGGTRVETEEAP